MGLLIGLLVASSQAIADVDRTDWPYVVVFQQHGRVPGGPGVTLGLAIWEDGAVLMPTRRCGDGKWMLVGRLGAKELAEALGRVAETGFFELERIGYAVPDAGYARMIVRHEGKLANRVWHGSLSPTFGGSITTDLDYLMFVKTWRATEAALMALTPVHVEPLHEHLRAAGKDTYRGYDPADPAQTPWLRGRNWERVTEDQ